MLASSYGWNSPRRRSATLAKAEKNAAVFFAAFAHARAVLAKSCGLNSPKCLYATPANAEKKRRIGETLWAELA